MSIQLKRVYTLDEIEALHSLGLIPDNIKMECVYTISRRYKFIFMYKSKDGKLYKWNSINGKYSRPFDKDDFKFGKSKFIVLRGSEWV